MHACKMAMISLRLISFDMLLRKTMLCFEADEDVTGIDVLHALCYRPSILYHNA